MIEGRTIPEGTALPDSILAGHKVSAVRKTTSWTAAPDRTTSIRKNDRTPPHQAWLVYHLKTVNRLRRREGQSPQNRRLLSAGYLQWISQKSVGGGGGDKD